MAIQHQYKGMVEETMIPSLEMKIMKLMNTRNTIDKRKQHLKEERIQTTRTTIKIKRIITRMT